MMKANGAGATQFEMLPIGQLQPSPTNPRKAFVEAELAELKASIAASGVQVPLLVRMLDNPDAMYEIVAGERRYRAAKDLGLTELPCLVRELTDEQAREAQIVENLQRAGIHPLEEAEAFEELRQRCGSIAVVAGVVAKEQSYVAKCLRLLHLTEQAKKSLLGGLITIDHALLLARLAEREQNDALKWTLDRNAGSKTPVQKVVEERLERVAEEKRDKQEGSRYRGKYYGPSLYEPASAKQLKARIENESGINLKRAPWKLDDANLLPAAGPCSTCEKNTKANTPLFGDLAIDEQRCTDGACYGEKTQAFVALAQLKAGHVAVGEARNLIPRLSWKASTVKPALCENDLAGSGVAKQTANPARMLRAGQWVEAKKGSCPNVRLGVTADWSDAGDRGYMGSEKKLRKPGETLLVCIAAGCKVHKKEWEGAKPKQQRGERYDPVAAAAEERRRQEARTAIRKDELQIREKLMAAILAKLDLGKALRVVAEDVAEATTIRKDLLRHFPKLSGNELEALTVFVGNFHRDVFHVNDYYMEQDAKQGVSDGRKRAWALAKRIGVDADAIAAKHFHDAGSIAPACDRLYPKGVPRPKRESAAPGKVTPAQRKKIVAEAKARIAKAKKKAKG